MTANVCFISRRWFDIDTVRAGPRAIDRAGVYPIIASRCPVRAHDATQFAFVRRKL